MPSEKERQIMQVKDVMTQHITVIDGMLTVAEVLPVFKTYNAFMLLVDKRYPEDEYGLLTLSEVARKVIAKNKSPERVNVYEIMLKPIVSVLPDMQVHYCVKLFNRLNIRRAPVIENHELKGVVSYKDIVLKGLLKDIQVPLETEQVEEQVKTEESKDEA